MINREPLNRLQERLLSRRRLFTLVHCALITVAAVFMLANPAHASAANWDPNNLFGGAFPSAANTYISAALSACSTSTSGTCSHYAVYAGANVVDNWPGTAATCIETFKEGDVDSPGTLTTTQPAGVSSSSLKLRFLTNGSGFRFYCWNGSSFVNRVNCGSTTVDCGVQATTDAVAPSYDVESFTTATATVDPAYGFGTSITTGQVLYGSIAPVSGLTAVPDTVAANEDILYTVTWSHLAEDPRFMYYYPQGRDTGSCPTGGCSANQLDYVELFTDHQIGSSGSGSFSFLQHYQFGGSYGPKIVMSPTCSVFQINTGYAGCGITEAVTASGVTVTGGLDLDTVYDVSLHFSSGSLLTVNKPTQYTWSIDPKICTDNGTTVQSKTFFMGYPPQYPDTGTALTGNSGTGTIMFPYTYQQSGVTPFPYVRVTCANGTGANIYYGSTLYDQRASPVYVNPVDFSLFWGKDPDFGGNSTDYNASTGSGAYFFSNKQNYVVNEPVILKYYYNVPFTISSIAIFPYDAAAFTSTGAVSTSVAGATVVTGTGAAKDTEHRSVIYYQQNSIGRNWPLIVVKSSTFNPSNAATYRLIRLGGNSGRDPQKYINVASGQSVSADILDSIKGNIFGRTATGGAINLTGDGIFGLSPSTFTVSFGNTDNEFLVWAGLLATYILRAAIYVMSFMWYIIKISPIFSFFDSAWHPIAGSIHTLPEKIANQPIAFVPSDRVFTIHYANETDGAIITWIVKIFIMGEVAMYSLKSIFRR